MCPITVASRKKNYTCALWLFDQNGQKKRVCQLEQFFWFDDLSLTIYRILQKGKKQTFPVHFHTVMQKKLCCTFINMSMKFCDKGKAGPGSIRSLAKIRMMIPALKDTSFVGKNASKTLHESNTAALRARCFRIISKISRETWKYSVLNHGLTYLLL